MDRVGVASGQPDVVIDAPTQAPGAGETIEHFDFDLPSDLIAQHPAKERSQSRLLAVLKEGQGLFELGFSELGQLLRRGDLLICNDSKVIPARLKARKSTGGQVEMLVERIHDDTDMESHLRARRPIKLNDSIFVGDEYRLTVIGRKQDLYVLRLDEGQSMQTMIATHGTVPLPPYIKRPLRADDQERYQTVYARHEGSVAAPTAGLHFSESLLQELTDFQVGIEYVTLHVGAGTFAPIRDGDIAKHRLHRERCFVSPSVCHAVDRTRREGGRVIAVGTTTVRVLEAVAKSGRLEPYAGETDLFIKPGFKFNVVDALITNFHLPRSTLLMLVCAFGGRERVLTAYHHAIEHAFKFYSYGDAMFIERKAQAAK